MSEQKRHPQHPGGAWPLNVEYRNEPTVRVMAAHPADAEELQAKAQAKANAQVERDRVTDESLQADETDAPEKSAKFTVKSKP